MDTVWILRDNRSKAKHPRILTPNTRRVSGKESSNQKPVNYILYFFRHSITSWAPVAASGLFKIWHTNNKIYTFWINLLFVFFWFFPQVPVEVGYRAPTALWSNPWTGMLSSPGPWEASPARCCTIERPWSCWPGKASPVRTPPSWLTGRRVDLVALEAVEGAARRAEVVEVIQVMNGRN